MKEFNIIYDKMAILSTIFVLVLVAFLFVVFNFFLAKKVDFAIILANSILIIPLLIAFFYAPKSYFVDHDKIVINKYYGNVMISINDIKKTAILKSNDLSGIYRKFASGGFFGYFGKFSSNKLKDIYIYSGSLSSNLVLIEKNDGTKYMIAPKELHLFMQMVSPSN